MEREGPGSLGILNYQKFRSSLNASSRPGSFVSLNGSNASTDSTPPPVQGPLPQRTLTIPRTQTVNFTTPPRQNATSTEHRGDRLSHVQDVPRPRSIDRTATQNNDRRKSIDISNSACYLSGLLGSMGRPTMSIPHTTASRPAPAIRTKHSGFGGFPMPHEIISAIFRRLFPKLERQLTRTVTIPRTQTLASVRDAATRPEGTRFVSYISFGAVVGRNSKFEKLSKDELEELGGVEYRGLTALLWIVGSVCDFYLDPLRDWH